MDLTGWTFLFTFGYTGDVYTKGNQRVMVNRNDGQVIIQYTII